MPIPATAITSTQRHGSRAYLWLLILALAFGGVYPMAVDSHHHDADTTADGHAATGDAAADCCATEVADECVHMLHCFSATWLNTATSAAIDAPVEFRGNWARLAGDEFPSRHMGPIPPPPRRA